MLKTIKNRIGLQYYLLKVRFKLLIEELLFLWRIRNASEIKIVIGSSGIFENGWIPTNYQYLNLLNENQWRRAFRGKTIDAILAEHVFEHLSEAEGMQALKMCSKFMKNGARLRVAVPDGYNPNADYIEMVRPGGGGPGSEGHKVLYNVDMLESMFRLAGFSVRRLEYYDSKGDFHKSFWNPEDGKINRSLQYDPRNSGETITYTSLILDGVKQ